MHRSVTILTAHFGDFDWTDFLIRRLFETVGNSASELEILVINQDRTAESRARLEKMGAVRVLEYPRNEKYFKVMGHDHPWVLDQALKEVGGDILVVFDCDAHPVRDDWFQELEMRLKASDAVLAEDHVRPGFPHPCFMAFTRNAYESGISFSEGVLEEEVDTGRLIHKQLEANGIAYELLPPQLLFNKICGVLYAGMVYHHGSGTFHASEEARLQEQVHALSHQIKRLVLDETRYAFPAGMKTTLFMQKLKRELTKPFRR
ncbi:glycosyltransferase family A protein [Pontiellaceae bacterium B1224]|nr:glycosyltransferase family A protein [Pontiellaceae bacterium B1224]